MRKQLRSVEQSCFQRRRRPPLVSLSSSSHSGAFILPCCSVFEKYVSEASTVFLWFLFFGSLMRVCRKNWPSVCVCVRSQAEWRGGCGSWRLLSGHLRWRQSHADLEEVCLPRHQRQMRAGLQRASILKTTWSRAHGRLTAQILLACLLSSTISLSARRSLCVLPGSRPWRTGRGRSASTAPCSGF